MGYRYFKQLGISAMASTAIGAISLMFAPASPTLAQSSAQSSQSPSTSLPAVTVTSPNPARPAARPARRAQQQPAGRTRRAVSRSQSTQPTALDRAGEGATERGNGPVNGYLARRSVTGTKTDTPLLEVPQSVSIVTKDQIQAQGAQNVMEALRYTPGVSVEGYNANAFFDDVKIRGFSAPRYLDGLRLPVDGGAFGVPRIETYGLERVEVLKGPSSGLYGFSDPGGLLNMVSKRPTATPHYEVEGTFGSFNRYQGAFDIGGPIDQRGEFLYRIVGLARKSDTQIDYVQDNKLFIAPSLTWQPTTDTKLTILSQYQMIDNKGYQQYVPGQVALSAGAYGKIPLSRYLGEPGHDAYKLEQSAIGYEFEHRFDNNLQFRQNLRYMEVTNNMGAIRGDYMADPLTFMPSDTTLIRAPIYTDASAHNLAIDNQLQGDFRTGILTHKLLVGLDYLDSRSSNRTNSPLSPFYTPQLYSPIDVFAPVYGATLPSANMLPVFMDMSAKQEQTGLYAQDQVKLDRWTLTLSGRQDWVNTELVSAAGAVYPIPGTYRRSDSAATGRVGLNYLFDFGLSPYVNYSTSFVPNAGVGPDGNSFKPTTGEGKEVGIKFMPFGTNLMLTAALFDITQNDVLTTSSISPLLSVQTDQARVKGYELEARGNLTRELEIIAGYSHLDPKISRSSTGTAGNYMPNVNLEQASLWGKYTWYDGALAGFGIGGGVRYVGPNYGDAANTVYIPSYTLFDAVVSYDLAYLRTDLKGWKAQVNATNLENKYYVTSCQSALIWCGLGTGRTVLGTLKYAWN